MYHSTKLISVIIFVLMFSSVTVTAGETGTIITKSGVEYANVWIVVDRPNELLLFKWDGEDREISFDDVAKVLDYRGEDISFRTLEEYDPPWEEKVVLTEEQTQESNSKPWRASISGRFNFCFLTGQYNDIDGSFGFENNIVVPFSRRLAIRLDISQMGVKIMDEWGLSIEKIPEQRVIGTEYDISARHYTLGVQWFESLNLEPGRPIFYSTLSLGTIRAKDKRYVYLRDSNTGVVERREFNFDANTSTVNFGGGAILLVSRRVGFDMGGEISILFSGDSMGSLSEGGIFDLKFGLIYLFR